MADILALKHVSRILGHCNNPALLVSHFQASISALEMPRPQTRLKGRLLKCPRILLTCFRARISEGLGEEASAITLLKASRDERHKSAILFDTRFSARVRRVKNRDLRRKHDFGTTASGVKLQASLKKLSLIMDHWIYSGPWVMVSLFTGVGI